METKEYKYPAQQGRYAWLKAHGICTKCGCEDAEPNKVLCFECGQKSRDYGNKYFQEHREKRNRERRKNYKKTYYERKEKGICTKCGKRKICRKSEIYCIDCYVRRNRLEESKRRSLISRSERPAYGFCYCCGKHELYSAKLCKECFEQRSSTAKKVQQNPTPAMLEARENYKNYFKAIFNHD